MLTIYGSRLCKHCRACLAAYDEEQIEYTFLDFGEELSNLKAFLKLRDGNPLFDEARKEGRIGIPCIVTPTGEVTQDWRSFCSREHPPVE